MMAIVHARGVARVYEESIEADLRGKYVIIDKLEDRVDELSDIETSQSIRLAQLEKGIAPYVEKCRAQIYVGGKRKSVRSLQHRGSRTWSKTT